VDRSIRDGPGHPDSDRVAADSADQLDLRPDLADHLAASPTPSRENAMSKAKKRPNKAKSIIAQPLFRSRQEQPAKGKGSYRREAFQSKNWEASSVMAA